MKKNKSFTLIELLVVISVIGLLASIILVSTKMVMEKAKWAGVKQFSASIKHNLGAYSMGEWSFENNLNDSSWNGLNLSGEDMYKNLAYFKNDVLEGQAICFVSNGYFVNSTDSSKKLDIKSGSITFETWDYFYLSNPNALSHVYIRGYSELNGQYPYQFFYVNGLLGAYLQNEDGYYCAIQTDVPVSASLGWHHFAITYDGNKNPGVAKIFVDGKNRAVAGDCSKPVKIYSNGSIKIMTVGQGAGHFRCFDELRVYDGALGSAQIQQHYAEGAARHFSENRK